jgi:type I restriction enzyme S subunit
LDEFLEIEIDLPALSEQRGIVSAIQTADEVVLLAEDEVAAARTLLLSAQKALIAECGAPEQRIGDFTRVVAGGTPSRQRPELFGGGVAWVKSGDIVFQDLYETPETITEEAVAKSSAKLLPAGTVVVAMYGQGATRGRSAVLRVPMTTNQACAGILPSDDHDERFLFHSLWSQYEELREDYDGTSQPNLNKGLIENVVLPLPSLEEQSAIAAELDAIEQVLRRAEREAEAARALRSSLVDSLLTGTRRLSSTSVEALDRLGS